MYYIDRPPNVIMIGRVGEHNTRSIQIDMSAWMADIPDGVPSIVVVRPGETESEAYIASTAFADNILTWVVTEADTETEGTGIIQVWLEESDEGQITRRSKSAIIAVQIYESIASENTIVPDPQLPWLEQMTQLRTDTVTAKNAAVIAQGKAEEAQDAAEIAAGIAIAQAGQLKFFINSDGHLIMAYTDEVPIAEEA